MSINYQIISSGSKGNAVIIEKEILIDCGVSYSALKPFVRDLRLVLLTHIHKDHFRDSTIKRLAFERPTIRFACGPWLSEKLADLGISKIDCLDYFHIYDTCGFAGFRGNNETSGKFGFSSKGSFKDSLILAKYTKIPHDVPNCCWKLSFKGKRYFYATDTYDLSSVKAENYDLYLIEANYKEDEIIERIREKREKGEYVYELDSVQRHLSEDQAIRWIANNSGYKSKYVLMHMHDDRKDDRKIDKEIREEIKQEVEQEVEQNKEQEEAKRKQDKNQEETKQNTA